MIQARNDNLLDGFSFEIDVGLRILRKQRQWDTAEANDSEYSRQHRHAQISSTIFRQIQPHSKVAIRFAI